MLPSQLDLRSLGRFAAFCAGVMSLVSLLVGALGGGGPAPNADTEFLSTCRLIAALLLAKSIAVFALHTDKLGQTERCQALMPYFAAACVTTTLLFTQVVCVYFTPPHFSGLSTVTTVALLSMPVSLLLRCNGSVKLMAVSQVLDTSVFVVITVALIGFAFGASAFTQFAVYDGLFRSEAITIFLLQCGLLAHSPQSVWVRVLFSVKAGSEQVRRNMLIFVPFILILAFVYQNIGDHYGDAHFALAAIVASGIFFIFFFGVRAATRVNKNQREMERLALTDPLTGVGNRRAYDQALMHRWSTSEPNLVTLIGIDLDGFKAINDLHGHDAGDAVLREVARRLSSCVRPTDLVARVGGDEFTIVLRTPSSGRDAARIARRCLLQFSRPIRFRGLTIEMGASIGVFVQNSPNIASSEITKRLDFALYAAKEKGKGQIVYYSTVLHRQALRQTQLRKQIKLGFERGEFVPFLQPIIDARSGCTAAFEVLARWNHPVRGILEPGSFYKDAVTLGLMDNIGWSVFKQALDNLDSDIWVPSAPKHLHLNVTQQGLVKSDLLRVLKRARAKGVRVTIEILETALVDDWGPEEMIALKTVRDLGAKIAIDDFGTGHASLTSLVRIKPDMLKLDRFIVHNCQTNSVERTVLTMALQMAKDLGIKTVCEGIETADQEASVCEEGADFLQGFRYSPAVPVSELAGLPNIFATNATGDLLKRDIEISATDSAVEAPLALPSLVS